MLTLKGEERKVKNRNFENILELHAHIGSGVDTWIILNNLPRDKHIVDIFKNGKGIIDLIVFKGYIENNKKQFPHYVQFRCRMTYLNYSLKIRLLNYGKNY